MSHTVMHRSYVKQLIREPARERQMGDSLAKRWVLRAGVGVAAAQGWMSTFSASRSAMAR
jgi:hypothetical protein